MFKPMLQCDGAARSRGRRARKAAAHAAVALLVAVQVAASATDLSSDPLPTLQKGSSVDVKPNILMILDNSGSMDWDFMPDWAVLGTLPITFTNYKANYTSPPDYMRKNPAFNGVAYNPAITYTPPVKVTASGKVSFSSMTAGNTSSWKAVPNDGFGVQNNPGSDHPVTNPDSSGLTDLTTRAEYYLVTPGEYCDSPYMTNCTTSTTATGKFQYPATLRWCSDKALTSCRALWDDTTYIYPRMPAPRIATLTVPSTSGSNRTINGILVDGKQIMSGATSSTSNTATLASDIANRINDCSFKKTNSCDVYGFRAYSAGSSNVVTIYHPGVPTVATLTATTSNSTYTGTVNSSFASFAQSKIPIAPEFGSTTSQSGSTIPGENRRTVLVSGQTYPKASTRTDCLGTTTCTYDEEMTNYANWWSYYRSRMQMMKTSVSLAFGSLDTDADIAGNKTKYRVGYMTINNNRGTGNDFVNILDFNKDTTTNVDQKKAWYEQMQAAKPNGGTPLREALGTAGQLYAGKFVNSDGTPKKIYGVEVKDPLQFSCQKNYTIMSTDGYWNGNGGRMLDGSLMDSVNYDGTLARPYNDGGTGDLWQSRTWQLQKTAYVLEKRTKSGRSWSSWAPAQSCIDNSNTDCRTNPTTLTWNNVTGTDTCTASGPDVNGNVVACRYNMTQDWQSVSSCTVTSKSAGPVYTVQNATDCQAGGATGGTDGTLADVASYYYMTDLRSSVAADNTGTCTGPIISPATTPTDLCADNVPAYGRDNSAKQHMTTHTLGLGAQGRMLFSSYQNDIAGNRVYIPDYWQQPTGDFHAVANGDPATTSMCSWLAKDTPCTWPAPASDDIANIDDLWHAAVNGHGTYFSAQDPASLATALTSVLSQIVNTPRPGTAAAAASSNPNITSSDNYVFSSSYKSVDWYGELIMQQFDSNGALSAQKWSAMRLLDCSVTPWSANKSFVGGDTFNQGGFCYLVLSDYSTGSAFDGSASGTDGSKTLKLSGTPVTRKIYTADTTASTPALVDFTWSTLPSALKTSFLAANLAWDGTAQTGLRQFCASGTSCLSSTAQTAAAGQTLVDFLRGDRTNEGVYFRKRVHVLGDIVSSEARYVKQPLQNYLDAGYDTFKTAKAGRAPSVYVGANDGMLHAFDALTGQERWAFIPSAVLPQMYRLADNEYTTHHRYFVDGTPEVGDVCLRAPSQTCDATQWRTILVGGLNQGGKSFYALDITDPAAPSLLWEYTDTHMGYTYSNPRITKLRNGKWVVIVASGYNNDDGVGRLYVLDAATGKPVKDASNADLIISTGAGSTTSDDGLARIAARAPGAPANNTVEQVYGGDLLGNVWRFDVNDTIAPSGVEAFRLVNLQDPSGNPQPITAKPTVTATPQGDAMVIVGTGRYLGLTDLDTTTASSVYSMYAIKDTMGNTTLTTPRQGSSKFIKQTMTDTTCPADAPATICAPNQVVRTASTNPVNWSTDNGWYTDFVIGGERSVTDATLALGTLVFTTVKPQSSTVTTIIGCSGTDPGVTSKSYLYYLNYLTGGAVEGTKNVVGEELCTCIATRPSVVKAQSGAVEGIIRTSGGSTTDGGATQGGEGGSTDMGYTSRQDLPYSGTGGATRRISWRELNGQ